MADFDHWRISLELNVNVDQCLVKIQNFLGGSITNKTKTKGRNSCDKAVMVMSSGVAAPGTGEKLCPCALSRLWAMKVIVLNSLDLVTQVFKRRLMGTTSAS